MSGRIDQKVLVEDDLISLGIYSESKKGQYFISEITCYYDRHINCLEIEYTDTQTEKIVRSAHTGSDSKYFVFYSAIKNKDKKAVLKINQDDCINYVKVSYTTFITSLTFKTHRGKSLNVLLNVDGESKYE